MTELATAYHSSHWDGEEYKGMFRILSYDPRERVYFVATKETVAGERERAVVPRIPSSTRNKDPLDDPSIVWPAREGSLTLIDKGPYQHPTNATGKSHGRWVVVRCDCGDELLIGRGAWYYKTNCPRQCKHCYRKQGRALQMSRVISHEAEKQNTARAAKRLENGVDLVTLVSHAQATHGG